MSSRPIPGIPEITPATPTTSENGSIKDGYFGPTTRSSARRSGATSPSVTSADEADADPDDRARARSRSPRVKRKNDLAPLTSGNTGTATSTATAGNGTAGLKKLEKKAKIDPVAHLQPPPRSYWRDLSRSPSPLGLIPIHTQFRQFIHRHEIPRKALHVSIGFLTTYLYTKGYQLDDIHPPLLTLLVPIASTDVIRHKWPAFNRFYIKVLGPLMRESEFDGYNGVVWYLLGAWTVTRFCPKDIGTVSILLLSWCDTAASTFGRAFGKYTPKIRKGKSLAGSVAALVCGVMTALFFWGYVAPMWGRPEWNLGENALMFQGVLTLPPSVRGLLGWSASEASISGPAALGVLSVVTGFIASASEAVDIFNWDDNLTIPVLCGVGLWGFLKIFT